VARVGERTRAYRVLVGKPEKKRSLRRTICVDGRIILKWIFMKWNGGMDWIDLAQDGDRWRALANTVMKLWGS